MTAPVADEGSFRDPGGRIYLRDNRVFRTVMGLAVADFEFVKETGVIEKLVAEGLTLPGKEVPLKELGPASAGAHYVLEHPRIPFVSYPYEWWFGALTAAALCHLDSQLRALERGAPLAGSRPSHIPFRGPPP